MNMYAQMPRTGGLFDFIGDIFDAVPGSGWIKDVAESGAGWIGDMAKTPVGFFTLQVITNNLYGPIARTSLGAVSGMQTVGPQIASVIWAVPGMVAGESFTDAYIKEFIVRVVALIEYFGGKQAGEIVHTQFSEPVKKLITENPEFQKFMGLAKEKAAQFGISEREVLKQLHLTPEELAAKFNVRPDVAAFAINGVLHKAVYDVGDPNTSEFDGAGHHVRSPDGTHRQLPATPEAAAAKRDFDEVIGSGTLSLAYAHPERVDLAKLAALALTLDRLGMPAEAERTRDTARRIAASRSSSRPAPGGGASGMKSEPWNAVDYALLAGAAGGLYLVSRTYFKRRHHKSRARSR